MGIEACTTGFTNQTMAMAKEFEEERKQANRKMLATIRKGGLSQKKNIQWFHAHDNYKGMGGKVLGSFCSYLRYQRGINPVKYLIGMMNVQADIPGWGKLSSSMVKVSGRAPQILTSLIEKGKKPSLSKILPESCLKVGGFGDGHSVAASGVFPAGKEELFLEEAVVGREASDDCWFDIVALREFLVFWQSASSQYLAAVLLCEFEIALVLLHHPLVDHGSNESVLVPWIPDFEMFHFVFEDFEEIVLYASLDVHS